MTIRILSIAESDLLRGANFYDRKSPGVGSYFLDSLYSDIDSLVLYGGVHRIVLGYHRMLSRRFPYAIYYKVAGEEVQVWRVLDCRRNPRWIRKQLRTTQ